MKKKVLGAFLSVAMVASMLVGCGGGDGGLVEVYILLDFPA